MTFTKALWIRFQWVRQQSIVCFPDSFCLDVPRQWLTILEICLAAQDEGAIYIDPLNHPHHQAIQP